MSKVSKKSWKSKKGNKFQKDNTRTNSEASASKDNNGDYSYHNDSSWYIPDEMLRKQVGSFSFSSTIGVNDLIGIPLSQNPISTPMVVGNIVSISMFPYIGNSSNPQGSMHTRTAINNAALKLYTEISSVNAKTTQYQPQDLAKAIIAVGEIVSLVAFAQRAYGIAFTFNPRNRTVPKDLILAMGIEPEGLLNHLSEYRMRLNKILTVASNIRMLRDIKYFTKCWEIYSHIFYDKNSAMGQYYVTRMPGYLMYDEDDTENKHLKWTAFGNPSNPTPYTSILQHLETAIDRILQSSLFNYVFTDIVNYSTKQGGELLGFSYIPELYQVFPEFSETFMNQVHNMDWGGVDLSNYTIIDDVERNELTSSWIFKQNQNASLGDFYAKSMYHDTVLDFPYTDNPTVDDIIDACVFKRAYQYVSVTDTDVVPFFVAASDHPVLDVYVLRTKGGVTTPVSIGANGRREADVGTFLIEFKSFDITPLAYRLYINYLTEETLEVQGQLNYWTVMKYEQLHNMFDYYRLGLFDADTKWHSKPM